MKWQKRWQNLREVVAFKFTRVGGMLSLSGVWKMNVFQKTYQSVKWLNLLCGLAK